MNGFTNIKDLDGYMVLQFSFKEVMSICSVNNYFFKTICDNQFFQRKLLKEFPDTQPYYEGERGYHSDNNYKNYYIQSNLYVFKMKKLFDYSFVKGIPIKQYIILKGAGNDNGRLLWLASYDDQIDLVKEAVRKGVIIQNIPILIENMHNKKDGEIHRYLLSLCYKINK